MNRKVVSVIYSILRIVFYTLAFCVGTLLAMGIRNNMKWWQFLIVLIVGLLFGALGYGCDKMSILSHNGHSFKEYITPFFSKFKCQIDWQGIKQWSWKKWVLGCAIVLVVSAAIGGICYAIYAITYHAEIISGGNEEVLYIREHRSGKKHFELFGGDLGSPYDEYVAILKSQGFKQRPSTGYLWVGEMAGHRTELQIKTYGGIYIDQVWVGIDIYEESMNDKRTIMSGIRSALVNKYGKPTQRDECNEYWNLEEGNIHLTATDFEIYVIYENVEYNELIRDFDRKKKLDKKNDVYEGAKDVL